MGIRLRLLALLLILDPSNHVLAQRFCRMWTLALTALAEQMLRYFSNEEQLTAFVEGVKMDVQNKDYKLYCYT